MNLTKEDIKRIVTDEEVERLTTTFCYQWKKATERIVGLMDEIKAGTAVSLEAEMYAAFMRMQQAILAMAQLNTKPDAFLYACYSDRMAEAVADVRLREAVVALLYQMDEEENAKDESFFDSIKEMLNQHASLSAEQQAMLNQKISPTQLLISNFMQSMKPEDMMQMAQVMMEIQKNYQPMEQGEMNDIIGNFQKQMEDIDNKLSSSKYGLLICMIIMIPCAFFVVDLIRQKRTDSVAVVKLFNEVLARVRKSKTFDHYWDGRRKTIRVINNDKPWTSALIEEQKKEKDILAEIPGDLFAKWMEESYLFEEDFLSARLDDDQIRTFIFHLACISELGREQHPTAKYGEELTPENEMQKVGDAVIVAAHKLDELVANQWYSKYDEFWQDLIQDGTIYEELKVTRNSPHNDHFTARFFCNIIGEMKKLGIFKPCSDEELASKLTERASIGTFRKNINERLNQRSTNITNSFNAIYQKYNKLTKNI